MKQCTAQPKPAVEKLLGTIAEVVLDCLNHDTTRTDAAVKVGEAVAQYEKDKAFERHVARLQRFFETYGSRSHFSYGQRLHESVFEPHKFPVGGVKVGESPLEAWLRRGREQVERAMSPHVSEWLKAKVSRPFPDEIIVDFSGAEAAVIRARTEAYNAEVKAKREARKVARHATKKAARESANRKLILAWGRLQGMTWASDEQVLQFAKLFGMTPDTLGDSERAEMITDLKNNTNRNATT
jgi:hypothetical protein